MPKTMKTFLEEINTTHPEEVIIVDKGPLRPHDGDPTAILYQFEVEEKWPMGIFNNVETCSGKKWPGSIQYQADGTFTKLMVAAGMKEDQWTHGAYFDDLLRKLRNPLKPVVVSSSNASVMYQTYSSKEINLYDLPIFIKDEFDARPGWLCGVIIGKRLGSGRYNLSWHRILAVGPERAPSRIQYRHLWKYMNEYKEAGHKRMPAVWVFGHHPMFMQSCAIKVGWSMDEYERAGGFLEEPLRLTPSATWGEDFLIPADAEVIVEGYLDLYDFDVNGPWGDFMRYYSPQTLEPVFTPTFYNFARNPIFDNHIARHDLYSTTGSSLSLYSAVKERYPQVKVAYRCAPYIGIIQFKSAHPGEARRMAMLALSSCNDSFKQIIVVDEDINPFDLHDVMFSLGTRVDAQTEQLQVIKGLDANRHDPSAFTLMNVGGFIIDSTRPKGIPFPELSYPGKNMVEKFPMADYVDKNKKNKIRKGLYFDIHPKVI